MSKIFSFILIGIILGLLCGLVGIPYNNYEINKCKHIDSNSNQYYEAQADCYLPLEKPEWNLFWSVALFSVLGIMLFGFIGAVVGVSLDGY